MMNNSKIGLALVGGYLLGRTRKAKMAIGLGMFLAGKKLNISPQQLAKMVANSPVAGQLSDQVRKDLVGNTKSALTSALTQRAGSLADSLHERTLDMKNPARRAKRSEEADDAEYAEDGAESPEDSHEEPGEHDEPEAREERPRARKSTNASSRTARSSKPAGSAASADGKKAASGRRTGGSGGTARKTASSGARKTTGGARKTAAKTASSGARKVNNRGGGNG